MDGFIQGALVIDAIAFAMHTCTNWWEGCCFMKIGLQ